MQISSLAPTLLLRALAAVALMVGVPALVVAAPADRSPEPPPAWHSPATHEVVSTLQQWLVDSSPTPEQAAARDRAARGPLNDLVTGGDRLDAVVAAVSIGSPATADLAAACQGDLTEIPALEWLDSADVPYWMRNNVRLYVARELIRRQQYELGLEVVAGLHPDDVFDPGVLLFYRAIAEHQLVRIDEARESLETLLDTSEDLPERFVQIARLMSADIAEVKDDSLDHIARRMSDVERRLDLRHADEGTQEVERGILASLDKVIEQLEEQARQRQQQQQQQSGGQPSAEPMEDSRIAEMKGEGKIDIQDIGDQAGWGDLPPRERERVLQQIGRDFPGHYRDLMEEYLKRLATDQREPEQP